MNLHHQIVFQTYQSAPHFTALKQAFTPPEPTCNVGHQFRIMTLQHCIPPPFFKFWDKIPARVSGQVQLHNHGVTAPGEHGEHIVTGAFSYQRYTIKSLANVLSADIIQNLTKLLVKL